MEGYMHPRSVLVAATIDIVRGLLRCCEYRWMRPEVGGAGVCIQLAWR